MHPHRSTSVAVTTKSVGFQIASNSDFGIFTVPLPLSIRQIRFHYGNSLFNKRGRPRHEDDQQYATTSSPAKSGSLSVLRRKTQNPAQHPVVERLPPRPTRGRSRWHSMGGAAHPYGRLYISCVIVTRRRWFRLQSRIPASKKGGHRIGWSTGSLVTQRHASLLAGAA